MAVSTRVILDVWRIYLKKERKKRGGMLVLREGKGNLVVGINNRQQRRESGVERKEVPRKENIPRKKKMRVAKQKW